MEMSLMGLGLGAVVGLILALAGAGGGILAVPLLVFGLHLTIMQAAPVGLIAVGAASGLGAALGLREGIVRYRAAALIGITGMLLAPVGVQLARLIPNQPLMVAFSVVLGWVAWRNGTSAPLEAREAKIPCVVNPSMGRILWTAPCAWALAGTGVVSGLLSGLLGVGGGFVIVPSLSRHTDLPVRSIFATSLAVIALVSIGGVAAAAWQGAIAWRIALPFTFGAMAALLAGRQLASRLAGARLQQGFAVTSGAVAMLLLARGLGWIVI
ncbi:MAG: sulfite exporter TauE/SafE family protein [Aquabacterium sp.]|uniref:sulfite exporter TauE/SafE family protein n=1 Tax=Aquabacterium sp. TaxID=1872578 RepID=UPI00271C6ED2|nr:sulfite exporter TauE/SafE family protein [Aquabacterium sp.]MDO9004337.1 sulfite exporter TauE/SafE family protein [Aquabacterium sp.]